MTEQTKPIQESAITEQDSYIRSFDDTDRITKLVKVGLVIGGLAFTTNAIFDYIPDTTVNISAYLGAVLLSGSVALHVLDRRNNKTNSNETN